VGASEGERERGIEREMEGDLCSKFGYIFPSNWGREREREIEMEKEKEREREEDVTHKKLKKVDKN
jgi:hypothetical protein